MKNVKDVNKYLSNVAILVTKLHNLHWNVEGIQFFSIHEYTEKLYDDFFGKYDDVAELIKMAGQAPLAKVSDYLANATVKELDSKAFTPKEVLETVKADLELMKEDAIKLRAEAGEEDNFALSNLMEDHISGYTKQLWFLNATLKGMK